MNFENLDQDGLESPAILSVGEAVIRIEILRSEIMAMGANDSEGSRINNSILQLKEGTLTPNDAVATVESIKYGKNDYH